MRNSFAAANAASWSPLEKSNVPCTGSTESIFISHSEVIEPNEERSVCR